MKRLKHYWHTGPYTAPVMIKMIMLVVVLSVFQSHLCAQEALSDTEEQVYDTKRQAGLSFAMTESGSSLGLFIAWPLLPDFHFGLEFDGFLLRDSKQLDYYDPYSGVPISINKQNNVYLLDFMVTVKKRLFKEALTDEFRPFFSAGLGPIYGMNFPEVSRTESDLNKNDEYRWTMGGYAGFGVDFSVKSNQLVAIRAQYRIIPFSEVLGERKNHSMFELRFELAQRF